MSVSDTAMFYIIFMKMMKFFKTVFIFLFICFIQITSFAITLEGGVTYTVDDVRKIAFENINMKIQPISIYDEKYKFNLYGEKKNIINVVDYNASFLKLISIKALTTIYKDNHNKEYAYIKLFGEYSLDSINIYEKLGNENYRMLKYDAYTGKLRNIFVLITEIEPFENQETYIFNAKGKLVGHWKGYNGSMYKSKVKLSRSIKYWEQE